MSTFQPASFNAPPPKKSGSGMTIALIVLAVVLLCCAPIGIGVGVVVYLASKASEAVSDTADAFNNITPYDATPPSAYGDPYSSLAFDASMGDKTLAAWNHMKAIDAAAAPLLDADDTGVTYWKKLQSDYRTIQVDGCDPEFTSLLQGWQTLADDYVAFLETPSFLQSDSTFEGIDSRNSALGEQQGQVSETLSQRYGYAFNDD